MAQAIREVVQRIEAQQRTIDRLLQACHSTATAASTVPLPCALLFEFQLVYREQWPTRLRLSEACSTSSRLSTKLLQPPSLPMSTTGMPSAINRPAVTCAPNHPAVTCATKHHAVPCIMHFYPLYPCVHQLHGCSYHGMWRNPTQNLVFSASLLVYLEAERLISLEEFQTMIGGVSRRCPRA